MKTMKTLLPAVLVALHLVALDGTLGAGVSHAARPDKAPKASSRGLDAAVANIQRQTGGRVLRAYQKGSVYVIKVLMPSGLVKTYRVRAQ